MKKEEQVIHWVEHKEEKVPECRHNHSHSDPTANEAIGNVMREERRKEKLLKEHFPQKQQEFDRTFKAGNRPLLKDVLTWFDNGTILHIGSKSAFYFIGTVKELKKDIKTHPVAALFLDMGLGKTVITLSAIEDLTVRSTFLFIRKQQDLLPSVAITGGGKKPGSRIWKPIRCA